MDTITVKCYAFLFEWPLVLLKRFFFFLIVSAYIYFVKQTNANVCCDLLEFQSGHFSSSMVPVLFWSHSQLNARTFPVHRFFFFFYLSLFPFGRTVGRSVILLAANIHTTKNKTMRSHKLLIHCKATNLLWISYLGKNWDGNNNNKKLIIIVNNLENVDLSILNRCSADDSFELYEK